MLATGVIAIPPSGPETVHSVKVFNLVLQINKQTDDSTLLDIQTTLTHTPLGKNTLSSMMTKISELSKLSMVYTNHSVRVTVIIEMDEEGIATTHIMRVSGHKSEESLKHYVRRLSDKRNVKIQIV